jgi:hypothetical protein
MCLMWISRRRNAWRRSGDFPEIVLRILRGVAGDRPSSAIGGRAMIYAIGEYELDGYLYELLAPIYGWFTEGFDSADPQ